MDSRDRSKDLANVGWVLMIGADQRRSDIPAIGTVRGVNTASQDHATCSCVIAEDIFDVVELDLVRLRTLEDTFGKWVSDLESVQSGLERRNELFRHPALDVQPAVHHADLTAIVRNVDRQFLYCVVYVYVVKDELCSAK